MSFVARNETGPVVSLVEGTQAELDLFLFLNMWPSHFGLPLLLAVVLLSKRVRRHPTLINLCVGFVLIGIFSCLLLYTGQTTGPEPSKLLCLTQASFLYGMPSLSVKSILNAPSLTISCSAPFLALMLVLQMFLSVRAAARNVKLEPNPVREWTMLVAPYIALGLTMIATAMIGASDLSRVSRTRRFFYCSVAFPALSGTITIVAAVLLMATIVLEGGHIVVPDSVGLTTLVWTLVILYKLSKRQGDRRSAFEFNMSVRVMVFGLYVIVAMGLSVMSVASADSKSPLPDLVIAGAATFILGIFGTQRDILLALCFWRPSPPPLDFESSQFQSEKSATYLP
ncbi:unnamed protein product [Mycena citricolor]|uniref:Uncharacterized protein n=1 Tax=Mycena citricolor TaxID=2018698 RepID=A0AAD2Q4N0_9AGAR|nr:unnamed protein product [Mycena citricolor]CAK5275798.1 unnamed protein product [Mycena citricolor]